MDKIAGYLEVGCNDNDEVVINHPDLQPDENGAGHIVFSVAQARNLASLLIKNADAIDAERRQKDEEERVKNIPPADRSQRTLTDGSPVTDDHRELKDNGQQKGYVVLSDAERAKGFVRPVRRTYIHKQCDTATTMSQSIAETYARDPGFYGGTFCVRCQKHFPLVDENGERAFSWEDGSGVGE